MIGVLRSFWCVPEFQREKGVFVLARRLKEKGIDPLTAEQVLDKMMEEEDEGMLCLRRALSICGLSGCCEIGEDGEICLLQEEASTLPPGTDALDYFEPQDESIRSDRNARYRYRERKGSSDTAPSVSRIFSGNRV